MGIRKTEAVRMVNEATTTAAQDFHEPRRSEKRTFQATGQTSAGAGAATVVIEASNDGANFITLGTISLTLSTTTSTDGFTTDAPWKFIRPDITAISGTGAAVSVWMGG